MLFHFTPEKLNVQPTFIVLSRMLLEHALFTPALLALASCTITKKYASSIDFRQAISETLKDQTIYPNLPSHTLATLKAIIREDLDECNNRLSVIVFEDYNLALESRPQKTSMAF